MASFADSERLIWELIGKNLQLRTALTDIQKVVAAVVRREGGVLIIEPAERLEMPAGSTLVVDGLEDPDGGVTLRLETGEPGQPGRAG
jgi:hypothetical protein